MVMTSVKVSKLNLNLESSECLNHLCRSGGLFKSTQFDITFSSCLIKISSKMIFSRWHKTYTTPLDSYILTEERLADGKKEVMSR